MIRLSLASRTLLRSSFVNVAQIRAFSAVKPQDDLTTTDSSMGRKWICGYENIKELEAAPENVKRIFSLENANRVEKRKVEEQEVKNNYEGYSQRSVAELTLKINTLERHMKERPKDKHNKVFLHWLTDQRKKKLKHLKNKDFPGYLQLLQELNIPELESPHSKWNKYKFRKFKIGVEVKEKRSFLDRKIIT
ncbi:28S ribosomal protein S15, mitochondrial isoform X1 [Nematostella vectensis]|uniref:28S ribosomal protein S15, mitochondrial isoform X1 n=1 Tax=Nematostella vectensis TaxID=45351 RepID=UPI0020770F38|nr:28S ribosomal protein S15, mitochondrial isoform X1 [Nematostella vectensis]